MIDMIFFSPSDSSSSAHPLPVPGHDGGGGALCQALLHHREPPSPAESVLRGEVAGDDPAETHAHAEVDKVCYGTTENCG